MKQLLLPMLVAGLFASPVEAQFYLSSSAFFSASGTPSYIETFESVPFAKDAAYPSFTIAGITYSGLAGTNVWVSSPGYNNFGAGLNPTTTSILTANGDENFLIELSSPAYAVGFDVYYNGLGPTTMNFYSGAWLFTTLTAFVGSSLGFVGYVTSGGPAITSVQFVSTDGGFLNTGIDNLAVVAVAPVPEPATLTLFGTGIAGLALLRRRRA